MTPVTEQNYRDYLNNDVEYYSPPQNPANDKLIITKVEPQLETRPSALTEEIRQYDEKQKSQQAGQKPNAPGGGLKDSFLKSEFEGNEEPQRINTEDKLESHKETEVSKKIKARITDEVAATQLPKLIDELKTTIRKFKQQGLSNSIFNNLPAQLLGKIDSIEKSKMSSPAEKFQQLLTLTQTIDKDKLRQNKELWGALLSTISNYSVDYDVQSPNISRGSPQQRS